MVRSGVPRTIMFSHQDRNKAGPAVPPYGAEGLPDIVLGGIPASAPPVPEVRSRVMSSLMKSPRHGRLPRPWVVGQHVAEGMPAQQLPVDGGDLMGSGVTWLVETARCGLIEVGDLDTARLGNEAEKRPVGGVAPVTAGGDHLGPGLTAAEEELRVGLAGLDAEGRLDDVRAVPLDVDDLDSFAEPDAPDGAAGLQVFDAGHVYGRTRMEE